MIKLVEDTITNSHIDKLCDWLKTYPRLTKGELTRDFEDKWGEKNGPLYSVFVNSGSSANLLMFYAASLLQPNKKSKNVIVPAVSWATTVTPVIQMGYTPIFCDCTLDGMSVSTRHFNELVDKYNPWCAIVVNPLGYIGDMHGVRETCNREKITLLEDSCETVGSTYNGTKAGNFGDMSTFSLYFGHHFSTIEGGMVCTDDKETYDMLLMLRSHGWDRDLDDNTTAILRERYNVNDFKGLYSFYVPGFNLRSTDLQAFLGLEQIKQYEFVVEARAKNHLIYEKNIKKSQYMVSRETGNDKVSSFAFPIISKNMDKIVDSLISNNIETRPLICGSMTTQPMFRGEEWNNIPCPVAEDIIDKYGFYLPNHPYLKEEEILKICEIVNKDLI